MTKKRIILVDDEPLIAELIKEMLDDEKGFEVSQITSTKKGFLEAISDNSFEIALVDISIGEREGGMDILRNFKEQNVKLPVIILSAHSEMVYGIQCLQAGAKGYVNKCEISSSLVQALKEVGSDKLFVSGERGADVLKEYKEFQSRTLKI